MQNYSYSRLQRRYEKLGKKQAYFLLFASGLILVVLVVFGLPFLFNLSSAISTFARPKSAPPVANKTVEPTEPRFAQGLSATNSAQTTLSGAADAGITVQVLQNNLLIGSAVASADGSFTFDITLNPGNNSFQAQAVSADGQKSPLSDTYAISFLTKSPKLEIASPKDGDSEKNSPVTINGKTDPNTSVAVNDHLVIVASDGSFNYNLQLSSGENKVKVVATDGAGNQTTKEFKVTFSP